MKFKVSVNVMPLKTLLDPQGKAVQNIIKNQGYSTVDNVRIGKHITFELEADSEEKAISMASEISEKILINPVIEDYSLSIEKL
jgi:phosphoribosylformylglycinamidine synthase PurS subunit